MFFEVYRAGKADGRRRTTRRRFESSAGFDRLLWIGHRLRGDERNR